MTIYRVIQKDYLGGTKEMGLFKKHDKAIKEIEKIKKACEAYTPCEYIIETVTIK